MITVQKTDFLNAIKVAKTSCGKMDLQPILKTIHIKSENGGLTLTGTDCTNTTRAVIEANATESIDVCLNADKLEAIVNRLGDEITLVIDGANALIKSEKLTYKLMYINSTEFPDVNFELDEETKITLDSSEFVNAINKTAFASALESINILSGICFTFNEVGYEVASTDGNRLSVVEYENPYINIKGKYILPKKTLVDIAKCTSGDVDLYLSDKRVIIRTANYLFSTNLLNGEYPDYKKLIPTNPNIATIDKKVILTALENVAIMSDDRTNIVVLDFKNNELELTTKSADIGEAKDSIDVLFDNKELKIAFNYRFLVEVLKSIDTDTVSFEMDTDLSPCIIKSDFLHLIMPIQQRG